MRHKPLALAALFLLCNTACFANSPCECYWNYSTTGYLNNEALARLSLDETEYLLQLDQLIAFACMDKQYQKAAELVQSLQAAMLDL